MRAELPDKFREAGPWTTVYEPGRFLRTVYWPFQKLAAAYCVTEIVCMRIHRFLYPFDPILRDPEWSKPSDEKPEAPVRGFPVIRK
jgi:hypothetical protein